MHSNSAQSKSKSGHSHTWLVGVLGIAVSITMFIVAPFLKTLAGIVFLFTLFHTIAAIILLFSTYTLIPAKIRSKFFKPRTYDDFDFGWSLAWMNGFWIAGILVLTLSVLAYIQFPNIIAIPLVLFLTSLNLFTGNIVMRASKKKEYMTLPFVNLFSSANDRVLDAGCGAGRTTIALSKVLKNGTIVAFDLFDSDYIVDGGKSLLEKNIVLAKITDKVTIVKGDVTKMEFKDNSFDAAVSTYMIDHLGKYKLDALREIQRVLKKGGKFLLIVFVPSWQTFAFLNILFLSLTSKKEWRKLFIKSNLILRDEGMINIGAYFLLEKE